ncbi:MAG: bifunctional phosphoglucose/phosphomannose isomerase [Calditrichaceae bacterium]
MIANDIKKITMVDKANMLDVLARFPEQIKEALTIAEVVQRFNFLKIDNVIVAGMGGSAISGDIMLSLFRDKLDVPLIINREYDLPKWVNKDTLVICISYSGNTDETLSSFKIASQKKCKMLCISTGGKLQDLAEKRGIPFIKIPAGIQPRAATAYLLFPSIVFLKKVSLLKETAIEADVEETIAVTTDFVTLKQIYGWGVYTPIAIRWRHQLNENSKIIARSDIVPECNHNDIVGWSGNPDISKQFSCILFRDKDEETIDMTTRLNFMRDIFRNTAGNVIEVSPKGKSQLAKMMYLMCLGDFTSCYLAVLRGINPSPVDIITELKKRLAEK